MAGEKLTPGECMLDDDGTPICNEDGELVKKDIEDMTEPQQEMIEEETSETLGDKFATLWNKTP